MRKEFWEDLKGCLRAKLIKARADWKYSQEEMAEALALPALREKAPPAPRRDGKLAVDTAHGFGHNN